MKLKRWASVNVSPAKHGLNKNDNAVNTFTAANNWVQSKPSIRNYFAEKLDFSKLLVDVWSKNYIDRLLLCKFSSVFFKFYAASEQRNQSIKTTKK